MSTDTSPLILGTMPWGVGGWAPDAGRLSPDELAAREAAVLSAALDHGIRVLDTADIYGDGASEIALGRALAALDDDVRAGLRVQTKCGILIGGSPLHGEPHTRYDSSPEHVRASLAGSLARLGLQRVDALIIHRPDPLTAVKDTVRAFLDAREAGLVDRLGLSNLGLPRARAFQRELARQSADDTSLQSVQVQLSLHHRLPVEAELMAHTGAEAPVPAAGALSAVDGMAGLGQWCADEGVELQAWSPLARGVSTDLAGVRERAERWSVAPAAVALAWLTRLPYGVRPVIGTLRPERIADAAGLAEAHARMGARDWYELLTEARGVELP